MEFLHRVVILASLAAVAFSCRKVEPPQNENELLAPLVTTSLRIEHLVADTLHRVEADKGVTLVFRQNLYNASLGNFGPMETRTVSKTARLQSLTIEDQHQEVSVSLGQMDASYGLLHGGQFPIPPSTGLSYGPIAMDGGDYFESMTLESGFMDVTIFNGFPTAIANVHFEMRNSSDQSLIVDSNIAFIDSGQTVMVPIPLDGKKIEAEFYGTITNFDIVGSNGQTVEIDTSDQVTVSVTVRDIELQEAMAIFPAQEVLGLKDTLGFTGAGEGVKLVKTIARDGFVGLRVVSTLEDSLYFHYIINESDLHGSPYELNKTIPPAAPGSSVARDFLLPIKGYTFDLTGAPVYNTFNAFYSELSGRIEYTGKLVHLTLEDSLLLYASVKEITPSYIEGYLGNQLASVGPDMQPFEVFKKIKGGQLDFKHINLSLSVENSTGIPAEIRLGELKAINSRSGSEVVLDISSLPSPLKISRANAPGTTSYQRWSLGETSSNLNELIKLLPDGVSYSLELESNPDKNSSDLSQFAFDTAGIRADLEIEMPLEFAASDLTLRDTVDFDPGSIKNPKGIISGTMYIVADNGYPVEARVKAVFLNANGLTIDSISGTEKLEAANTNEGGRVTEKVQSAVPVPFTRERIDNWLRAEKVVFEVTFSTPANVGHVKLYDFYTMGLILSARFKYLFE